MVLPVSDIKNYKQWPQYLAVLAGLHTGWTSAALPILLSKNSQIPITSDEASWIVVFLPIGIIVGSPLTGYLFEHLGRKVCLIGTVIPHLSAWLIIAFSKNLYLIYFARFLSGVGEAMANTVLPLYTAEISETRIRGIMGSINSINISLGILFANIIGSYTTYFQTTLICSGLVVFFLIAFSVMPESPYYLIMKNDYEAAKKSLEFLRSSKDVDNELKQISKAVENQMATKSTYRELFMKRINRNTIIMVICLEATQQLSGITAIQSYTQIIFEQSGQKISASTSAIIILTVQLVMLLSSTYLVDCLGRKPLLIISAFGSACSLFIEGLYFYILEETTINLESFGWIALAAMISYIVTYSIGLALVLNVILGEIFSASIKGKASYINCMFYAAFTFIASKFFMVMKENAGMYLPFWVYSLCCSIGLILIWLFLPETKGKTLEEIQDYFKEKNKNKHEKDILE